LLARADPAARRNRVLDWLTWWPSRAPGATGLVHLKIRVTSLVGAGLCAGPAKPWDRYGVLSPPMQGIDLPAL